MSIITFCYVTTIFYVKYTCVQFIVNYVLYGKRFTEIIAFIVVTGIFLMKGSDIKNNKEKYKV